MKIIKNLIVKGKHNKPIVTDIFYKEDHQPKKVVIFCHGYKGFKDWGAWNLMAASFANAGFFFIKFNFSHNGGTPEQPIDFSDLEAFGNNNYSKELDDLGSIIDWVSTNSDFEKEVNLEDISIIGHSRGGGIVLLKTNEDSRIKKVITLAGVCEFEKRTAKIGNLEQWKNDGVKYVENGRTKQQMPHYWQFYTNFIENKKRLTIKRAAQELQKPLLLIHGDLDNTVPLQEAQNLHQWSSFSELFIAPEANHVFNGKHPYPQSSMPKALTNVVAKTILFLSDL